MAAEGLRRLHGPDWYQSGPGLYGAHDLDSYVDDVLGHTGDWERHKQMLRNFFERVKGEPSKCKIRSDKVNFLGHTLQKNSNPVL